MKIFILLIIILFVLFLLTPYINLDAFMAAVDGFGFIDGIFKPVISIIEGCAAIVTDYEMVFMMVTLTAFPLLVLKLFDFI